MQAQTPSSSSRASTATACAASRQGTYAPDLTHLMSRKTLASGMIPNTPENLREVGARPAEDQAGLPDAGLRTERTATPISSSHYLETLQ